MSSRGNVLPSMWRLRYSVPFDMLPRYLAGEDMIGTSPWWANLFKGFQANSRPHWGAWQDVGQKLSVAQRGKSASIAFEQ